MGIKMGDCSWTFLLNPPTSPSCLWTHGVGSGMWLVAASLDPGGDKDKANKLKMQNRSLDYAQVQKDITDCQTDLGSPAPRLLVEQAIHVLMVEASGRYL